LYIRPTGPVSTSSADVNPILAILSFPIMGAVLVALAVGAYVTLKGLALIVHAEGSGMASVIYENVIATGVAGLFAGAATALIGAMRRKSALAQSVISGVFNPKLAAGFGESFWTLMTIESLIGLIVGALNGGAGIISFPQLLFGSHHLALRGDFYPIAAALFGGGGSGGTGDGSFWSIVWVLLCLVLVVLACALIIGFFAGPIVQIAVTAFGGAVKGAAEAAAARHPLARGIARGLKIGLVVGIIEAVFSAWGYLPYHIKLAAVNERAACAGCTPQVSLLTRTFQFKVPS